MIAGLSSLARVGLIALGLSAGATSLTYAGQDDLAQQDEQFLPIGDAGVTQVDDDSTFWRRRGAWQQEGNDWNDTRAPEGRRGGWDGDGHRDDWRRGDWRRFDNDGFVYRRYHRRPQVYLDLDLTPQRYIQPRYHVQPRRTIHLSRAHVAWCYDRYRSYRASDNSFQPNYGPRRQCYSPYL